MTDSDRKMKIQLMEEIMQKLIRLNLYLSGKDADVCSEHIDKAIEAIQKAKGIIVYI